jgi:hypothetical protein
MQTIVKRMDVNEAIFKRILDDKQFQQTVLDYYADRLYERLRGPDRACGARDGVSPRVPGRRP